MRESRRIGRRRHSYGLRAWWGDIPRDTWREWAELAGFAVMLPLLLAELLVVFVGMGVR